MCVPLPVTIVTWSNFPKVSYNWRENDHYLLHRYALLTTPYLLYKHVFKFLVGDRVVGRYHLHYRTLLLRNVSPGKTGVKYMCLDRGPRDLANFNLL
jgi:hypothetical protein